MASLLGGIAAGLQIAEGVFKLHKQLRNCIKTIHDAPKEINAFCKETLIFSNNLIEFHSVAEKLFNHLDPDSAEARTPELKRMAQTIWAIVEQSRLVKKGFKNLLERVRGIGNRSMVKQWIARVRWYLQQAPVRILQSVLNSVKLNVIMITQGLWCRVWMKKIKRLEKENKKIPAHLKQKICLLEKQLEQHKAIARSEQRRLHNLLNENPNDTGTLVDGEGMEEILRATTLVEKYIRREIRRNHAEHLADSPTDSQRTSYIRPASSTVSQSEHISHLAVPVDRQSNSRKREATRIVTHESDSETARIPTHLHIREPGETEVDEDMMTHDEAGEGIAIEQGENRQRREVSEIRQDSVEFEQAIEEPTPNNFVGRVVYMNDNGSVQEFEREWRVSGSESGDAGREVVLEREALHTTDAHIELTQEKGKERETSADKSNSRKEDTAIGNPLRQKERSSSSFSRQRLKQDHNQKEESKDKRRPRNIWEEMSSKTKSRAPSEASASQYKPAAPFQESDRKKKLKPRRPGQ